MPSFKDANQQEWLLSLDAPTIKAVRSECDGLDLADVEGRSFAKMQNDPCLLVDVLWIMCRKQASDKGISDEQFGRALVGDSLESATTAMLESIADFFPSQRREILRAVVEKEKTLRQQGMQIALSKINDPTLEAEILKAVENQTEEELKRALTRLRSATNLPDSSGSTQPD